ncbi:Uncharacterised protein [Vibrio cholerae]|nr:Uncharacterised protein [Vibrio cholerae]
MRAVAICTWLSCSVSAVIPSLSSLNARSLATSAEPPIPMICTRTAC